jgi:hypothetical protein
MLLSRVAGEERPLKKRYPLEPLVTLRRDRVDRRARELGDAERKAALERAALAESQKERTGAESRARAERVAERARLDGGLERVQDLTRGELHRVRARMRIDALAATERRAERKTEAAERTVGEARSALGAARSDARTLERQKQRFEKAGERAELAAEEEAASDFHAVLSRRRKR